MRTPEEHLDAVAGAIPGLSWQTVLAETAADRVLAADVTAPGPSPRFDNSQMDGWAIPAARLGSLPATLPVGPTIAAGADPARVLPGGLGEAAAAVMTGARLPAGTGAVVPVEDCDPDDFAAAEAAGAVRVPATPAGRFIRAAGSDLRAGETVLRAGDRLTPVAVAALIGLGVAEVPVLRRPRVILCTGGAEIGRGGPAGIPDSNGPMLELLCAAAGIDVARRIRVDDDPAALLAALDAALADSGGPVDAILTSGGISHGRFEVVRLALGAAPGAWFGHVAQQPGGPQGLTAHRGVPVVCLPGNPMSTLVSFRLFARPALLRAEGRAAAFGGVTAVAAEPLTGLPDARVSFRRGRLRVDGAGRLAAAQLGGGSSHLLAQAATADCLIRVPGGGGAIAAGDPVTVHPL